MGGGGGGGGGGKQKEIRLKKNVRRYSLYNHQKKFQVPGSSGSLILKQTKE